MENCIMIGNKIEKDSALFIGEFVSTVFKSGRDNNMEQSTIVEALKLFKNVMSPAEGVNISNCVLTGEKTVNIDTNEE